MTKQKNFVDGLIIKRNPNAPEYVICALSIKTDEFSDYMEKNKKNGWINIDVKRSFSGKYYGELNEYVKSVKTDASGEKTGEMIDTTKTDSKTNPDPKMTQIEGIEMDNEPTDINPEDIPF